MTITAGQVKELRERTGAGMMECKKALVETGGDIEAAVDVLRKTGLAKAGKKASRVTSEGMIAIEYDDKAFAMVEVNCETDFVAREENFIQFVKAIARTILAAKATDIDSISKLILMGTDTTVEEARQALSAKIGENITVRRAVYLEAETHKIGTYLHGSRIGVLVKMDAEEDALPKDIAMHIAASKPLVISPEDVPQELVEKEREIYMAQAAESGKPQEIIEKMVSGKLKKYLDEVSLLGQPFVKDPDVLVSSLLNKNRGKVISFTRFEVGEGIEKATENFVEAVMAQVQGGN